MVLGKDVVFGNLLHPTVYMVSNTMTASGVRFPGLSLFPRGSQALSVFCRLQSLEGEISALKYWHCPVQGDTVSKITSQP